MIKADKIAGTLDLQELEAVYAISKVVAESIDVDYALDQIVKLTRPVFIFDHAVLYLRQEGEDSIEPTFARAIGRGRSSEADIAWGELAAREVFATNDIYLNEPNEINLETERINQAYFFGIPMVVGGKTIGALIYIRFGGPEYTEDQINVAEFIAAHISQLYEHQRLVDRVANLEAKRRLARLQEDFIAAVSHELNTPLGFIKGYTTTLLREDTQWDAETSRTFLNIIDEEADRLSELIDDLLDSSRLQTGAMAMEFQDIALNTVLEEQLSRLRIHHDNLTIQFSSNSEEINVDADPKRLRQVVDNIIGNASKYASGSNVKVSTNNTTDKVIISISDDGPGIPNKHLESLFNRFYRVPERSAGVRGSGLGLYICNQIIQSHEGTIVVKSEEGEGTHFEITLPINSEKLNQS